MGEDENESGGPCWLLNRFYDQSIPIKPSNYQILDFVDIGGEAHPHSEYERDGDHGAGASPGRPGHPGPGPADGQGVGPDVHVQPAQPAQPETRPRAEVQDVPNGSPR